MPKVLTCQEDGETFEREGFALSHEHNYHDGAQTVWLVDSEDGPAYTPAADSEWSAIETEHRTGYGEHSLDVHGRKKF